MQKKQLDELDLKILDGLAHDARTSNRKTVSQRSRSRFIGRKPTPRFGRWFFIRIKKERANSGCRYAKAVVALGNLS